MLNTRNPARRGTRSGPPRPGTVAGLTIAGLLTGSVLLGGAMFLAGCSAGSSSGASNSAAAPAGGAAAADGAAASGAGAAGAAPRAAASGAASGPGTGTTARLAPASSIIYTAQLTVRAREVNAAAAQAASITEGAGGRVSDETLADAPDHPSQATASIELKIPVAAYQATLVRLARGLGTQLSLRQQAQDVTQQVADVNSQVTSDEAAIAQLRVLLSHADSVGDLLSVQNQINAEESALESMQAQQRALGRETSYATVTVTILGPSAKPAHGRPKPPPGLASGFGAGWRALRITVAWLLAILGAVAPFAAVAAVAGYGAYRGRRRMLRRRLSAPES